MKKPQRDLPERKLNKPKYFLYKDECPSLYTAKVRYTYRDYVTWDGHWELIDGIPYIDRGCDPDEGDNIAMVYPANILAGQTFLSVWSLGLNENFKILWKRRRDGIPIKVRKVRLYASAGFCIITSW